MAPTDEKKRPVALTLTPVRSASTDSSSSTSTSSLKPPRTPRFVEATSVRSPTEAPEAGKERSVLAQAQPGDVGFGYIGNNNEKNRESVTVPMTPKSPLKSAMKVPGTPGRGLNPLSPTFREEAFLEKRELLTEKEQARDLRIKTRVRMAKFALRGVNFSCSLIVLSMLTSTITIFNATKELPTQNNLPAWAENTTAWPQKVVLGASCVSLFITIIVFVGYCRGGHKRAEKVGVYYTLFAVAWFIFSMIMWVAAAGILQITKNNSGNQDIWGWSCVQNHRAELFQDKVDYALVCRLQNWSLVCAVVEIVVEVISISLYSIVFYRYHSKRRLHKSMDLRDKARSDLYLAQLRTQSAPNTPGFGPKSPSFGSGGVGVGPLMSPGLKSPAFSQYALSPRFPPQAYRSLGDMDDGKSPFTPGGSRLIEQKSAFTTRPTPAEMKKPAPFRLQAPPTKAPSATPRPVAISAAVSAAVPAALRSPTTTTPPPPTPTTKVNEHAPVAPGEKTYDAVPIPGAYAGAAIKSPPPLQTSFAMPPPGPAFTRY